MQRSGVMVLTLLGMLAAHAADRPMSPPVGSIVITRAWSRATPPGVSMGVIYLDITNGGSLPDQLLALNSPAARSVELHQSRNVDGVMQMRPVSALACPPRTTVKIEPGGLHIMLVGLERPLSVGTEVPLTLHFLHAGDVSVSVSVGGRDL